MFVPRPDESLGLCIDYRALNRSKVLTQFPLPRMDKVLDRLECVKRCTKIDLSSGYWQLRIAQTNISKTAFKRKYGPFEFLVMQMGLCAALGNFISMISKVLGPFIDQFVQVYLNDTLVYFHIEHNHASHELFWKCSETISCLLSSLNVS